MEKSLALLNLLERVLGKGERKSKGNYAFICPNCNHTKKKLEVNLELYKWECWVCGSRDNFKGKKISTLLKKIKADAYLDELKTILPNEISSRELNQSSYKALVLPKEMIKIYDYIPQTKLEKIKFKKAISFLKKRGLEQSDIIKYDIGACFKGEYEDRIIIPSYDETYKLNYFVARDFTDNLSQKYKNPQASADVIGLELFINWNMPVIICEGIFDALTIKRNAIPLYGKVIHKGLMKKLVMSSVKEIYISLDKDAIKDALKYCEELISYGKLVYLVELDGKDANEIGFTNYLDTINKVSPLDFQTLLMKKLKLYDS